MSEKMYAIKCTNCAAPLDILGGGRVQTITCAYCHSTLDLNDSYKVLAKFDNVRRPLGPFEIGMRGNIKGVEWTIIGWISYKTAEFPSEEWDEFFLYSPTHGYAWLVYEDGKVSFSKRVRDFDILTWQEKKPKTTFYHKGHYLRQDSSYLTYVQYVEGELSWVAKFGDKFTTWDYNGVRYQTLSIEKNADELEVFYTQKLDKKDIYNAFSLEYTENNTKKEPLKKESKRKNFINENRSTITNDNYRIGFLFLFILLIFLNIMSFFIPTVIYNASMPYTDYNESFQIDTNQFMTSIVLGSQKLGKSDIVFSLYKNEKHILTISKDELLYTTKDLINTWNSNSYKITLYLKLNQGLYYFNVKNKNLIDINITIKQKVIRLTYFFPLLLIFFIFILYFDFDFFMDYIEKYFFIGLFFTAIYFVYHMFNPVFATILILLFTIFYWNTKDKEWDDINDDWDFDDD